MFDFNTLLNQSLMYQAFILISVNEARTTKDNKAYRKTSEKLSKLSNKVI